MLFEETNGTLFRSDLFHQIGQVEPLIESDLVLERTKDTIINYQAGPLVNYMPYTHNTNRLLNELADFYPKDPRHHARIELQRRWRTVAAKSRSDLRGSLRRNVPSKGQRLIACCISPLPATGLPEIATLQLASTNDFHSIGFNFKLYL